MSLFLSYGLPNSYVGYFRHEIGVKLIGKRIRSIRKEQGISQAQLGFECGLAREQIGKIEKGITNTSISNILIIANALNIHPKELLDIDFEVED